MFIYKIAKYTGTPLPDAVSLYWCLNVMDAVCLLKSKPTALGEKYVLETLHPTTPIAFLPDFATLTSILPHPSL